MYKGPMNYITIVEAYKSGPFTTTPLRKCINSSMNQPAPPGRAFMTAVKRTTCNGRSIHGNVGDERAQGDVHERHQNSIDV
jgi:hypothetical protein